MTQSNLFLTLLKKSVDPFWKLEEELITVQKSEVISLDSDDDITDVTDDVTAMETFGQRSKSGRLFRCSVSCTGVDAQKSKVGYVFPMVILSDFRGKLSWLPSGRCTPLYNIREKKMAENRKNNWKKFYQHQTSRNVFLQIQKLQKNRQVEPIDLLPEIRHLTNVSSSIDKNAILSSFMVS